MEVLTSDRRARSQLSILLRELGHTAYFHETADRLKDSLNQSPEGRVVLVDLGMEFDHEALVAKYGTIPGMRFIGLQFFSSDQEAAVYLNAKHYRNIIVLPAHAERAKSRLRNVLTPKANHGTLVNRRATSFPAAGFAPKLKTRPSFSMKRNSLKESAPFRDSSRYLTCRSDASMGFLQSLQKLNRAEKLTYLLLGEEGAEFELVCREINFQSISDRTALHMVAPDDLCMDALEKLERAANRERSIWHVYVGRSDEYSAECLRQFALFADYLGNLRNPHIRIYMAHAKGSEEFFREGVGEVFKSIAPKMEPVHLPSLAERPEDIPAICHATVGSLRAAHPFLAVQRIANAAIDYLVETRDELSHQKLIRILRNSIALSQSPELGIEDIKNYGESDMTTQHLLESMADENFFPAEQPANF